MIKNEFGKGTKGRIWTEFEDLILREYGPFVYVDDLAELLERTPTALRGRAYGKGVKLNRGKGRAWTEDEERFLTDVYADYDTGKIATVLGRTQSSVKAKATKMRLRKRGNAGTSLTTANSL